MALVALKFDELCPGPPVRAVEKKNSTWPNPCRYWKKNLGFKTVPTKNYTHTQALVRAPGRSWIRCVLCRKKRTLFRFLKCCQRAETRNSLCVDVERPSFQLENPTGICKKSFSIFSKVKKASQATSAGHRPTQKRRQLSTLFQTTIWNLEHVFFSLAAS